MSEEICLCNLAHSAAMYLFRVVITPFSIVAGCNRIVIMPVLWSLLSPVWIVSKLRRTCTVLMWVQGKPCT